MAQKSNFSYLFKNNRLFCYYFFQLKNKTPMPCEDIGHVSIDIEVNKIFVQLLDISKC